MTFSSAVKYLRDGQAAKVPSMSGYVYRNDDAGELPPGVRSRYTIGFKERGDGEPGWDPDGDGTTVYAFAFAESDDGSVSVESPSVPLKLDGQLLQALLSDAWTVGQQQDFEASRTGTTASGASLRW